MKKNCGAREFLCLNFASPIDVEPAAAAQTMMKRSTLVERLGACIANSRLALLSFHSELARCFRSSSSAIGKHRLSSRDDFVFVRLSNYPIAMFSLLYYVLCFLL
jgi:hypothetical protein